MSFSYSSVRTEKSSRYRAQYLQRPLPAVNRSDCIHKSITSYITGCYSGVDYSISSSYMMRQKKESKEKSLDASRAESSPLYLERRRSAVTMARSTELSSTAMTHGSTSASLPIGTATFLSSPAWQQAPATSIDRDLGDRDECSVLFCPALPSGQNKSKRQMDEWRCQQCNLRRNSVGIFICTLSTHYRRKKKEKMARGSGGIGSDRRSRCGESPPRPWPVESLLSRRRDRHGTDGSWPWMDSASRRRGRAGGVAARFSCPEISRPAAVRSCLIHSQLAPASSAPSKACRAAVRLGHSDWIASRIPVPVRDRTAPLLAAMPTQWRVPQAGSSCWEPGSTAS
jgi:hypothetical protein